MRALIAMSGGVDSSAAALCMQRDGCTCIGVTMKLYDNEEIGTGQGSTCCSLDDVEDARAVCYRLGITHYVVNLKEEFSRMVIDRFVRAYERGDTPNPCIDCNRFMKFSRLFDKARILDCDVVVTGHYARTAYDEKKGVWQLKKARNTAKDQSYVLYFLDQAMLSRVRFPLGEFEDKEQIRQMAEAEGFVNARKRDSQDICFVPGGDYTAFIENRTGFSHPPGNFVDASGRVLGQHRGLVRYTIGQRRGLGLALPAPLYVRSKNYRDNTVLLTPEKDLYTRELTAGDFNWIPGKPPKEALRCTARPRYRAPEAPAVAEPLSDGRVRVIFDEPQRAITSGQAVVLYDGENVLGGGTIQMT